MLSRISGRRSAIKALIGAACGIPLLSCTQGYEEVHIPPDGGKAKGNLGQLITCATEPENFWCRREGEN